MPGRAVVLAAATAVTLVTGAGALPQASYDFGELGPDAVDYRTLPAPVTFTARDGVGLAVRVYGTGGATAVVALHGSAGEGSYFHPLAEHLAARANATVYVPDLRGHGLSGGRRGDVEYIGQLEVDLSEVLTRVRKERPDARLVLLGHSAGGGLVIRYAGSSRAPVADAYVLLAPALPPSAPTTRPGAGGWVQADVPKIMELGQRALMGDAEGQDEIVVRFNKPEAWRRPIDVLAYSFRMVVSYGPRRNYTADLAHLRGPLLVMVGERDESFYPEKFEPTISPHARGTFKILPGVSHLGIVVNRRTAEQIEAWLAGR